MKPARKPAVKMTRLQMLLAGLEVPAPARHSVADFFQERPDAFIADVYRSLSKRNLKDQSDPEIRDLSAMLEAARFEIRRRGYTKPKDFLATQPEPLPPLPVYVP